MVSIVAAALATAGCHNEEDCGGQVLPAGVELEVTLTGTVSDEGCDGMVGTSLGSQIRHVTGKPLDTGAHNKCMTETLEAPAELYGFSIDSCVASSGGFTCVGSPLTCPSQRGSLDIDVFFGDLPAAGSKSEGLYGVEITAGEEGDCPAVDCNQLFDVVIKRL